MTFILSLLISDAFASLLLGSQLLFGAYLPEVFDYLISPCFLLLSEAFKLAGVVVTVFHLLLMVMMHLAGVAYPVQFKEVCNTILLTKGSWKNRSLVGLKVSLSAA